MTLASEIEDDYLDFDDVETVIYTPRPTGTPVATAKALRHTTDWRDLQISQQMGLESPTVVFNLFDATLSNNTPKNGDTITDSNSNVYTIQNVSNRTLNTRWRCACRPAY